MPRFTVSLARINATIFSATVKAQSEGERISDSFYQQKFPALFVNPIFLLDFLSLPNRQRFINFLCPLSVKCLFWRVIPSPWNTSSRIFCFSLWIIFARFSGFSIVTTTADFFDFRSFKAIIKFWSKIPLKRKLGPIWSSSIHEENLAHPQQSKILFYFSKGK